MYSQRVRSTDRVRGEDVRRLGKGIRANSGWPSASDDYGRGQGPASARRAKLEEVDPPPWRGVALSMAFRTRLRRLHGRPPWSSFGLDDQLPAHKAVGRRGQLRVQLRNPRQPRPAHSRRDYFLRTWPMSIWGSCWFLFAVARKNLIERHGEHHARTFVQPLGVRFAEFE